MPCSDDSSVFCFHFWRLSGLHVVPFKGCLGGSCILLCAYEGEMSFSVPKYCKNGLCKKAACSYWKGGANVLSRQSDFLFTKHKCFGRGSEMPHKIFWCFPGQRPAWDQGDFLRELSLKNEATLRLYIWNWQPVFQISNTSCLGMLCPQQHPSSDGQPVVLVWQADRDLWLPSFPLCTLETMQHWKKIKPM